MFVITWGLVVAVCAGHVLGAACGSELPLPLGLPITDTQVDPSIPNSFMRGIPARIGTPPQSIVVVPWPDLNNTYLYDDQAYCNPRVVWNEEICRIRRGGNYVETQSSSFTKYSDLVASGGATQEIGTRGSEPGVPKLISTSLAGTELFVANGTNATIFPVGIPRQQYDGGYTTLHVLGLGSNSTYLNALVAARQIPSRVWSIFWGRMWTGSASTDMDGSLVLGGYDRDKVIGRNFTQPLDYSEETGCWTGMKVTVSDLIVNFRNGTDISIMSSNSAVKCCIVPQRQLLWEGPAEILGRFEGVTGLWERNMSFGLHRDARVINMTAAAQPFFDGDVTFILASGLQVRIPNNQFIVPHVDFLDTGARTINQSQKEILMSPVASNPASLGRYFFTSAYLMVDYDSQTFTMWQANPSKKSTLTPVVSKPTASKGCEAGTGGSTSDSTDGGDSNPTNITTGSSISTGAITGAAVGGAAALALIAAVVFLFVRRRKQKERMAPLVLPQQESTDDSEVTYYRIDNSMPKEVPGSMPKLAEMRADEYHRPRELHGNSLLVGNQSGVQARQDGAIARPMAFELDGSEGIRDDRAS